MDGICAVTSLNMTTANESVFGHVNVVQPQASRQFLYCLAPQPSLTSDLKLLSGATNVGKLDIVWRSNLGERGRLQTSQLQRMEQKHNARYFRVSIPVMEISEEPV
ncbi:hypothetical protein PR048_020544 [Dryococelus australis]|uniref:Trafficking protein particle complex subunit 13 middle domain-containing protein n=1 Tax=Dryococelus australis TaxID=614101 RepID=A0ABQ9H6Z6_9NEOP|nr:hypothetical protein PR048_020544 [Dryococelus australis]